MSCDSQPFTGGVPDCVLNAWGGQVASYRRVSSGHINQTFFIQTKDKRLVLQRLNPIFSPQINLDIEAITSVLEKSGMFTPRLVRTCFGDPWFTDPQGGVWRALTFIPGEVLERADTPNRCYTAGCLLGAFHLALWDCRYQFRSQRLGVHDTKKHLLDLEEALKAHTKHRLFEDIEKVAVPILELGERLHLSSNLPDRFVHGDPKITNIIFDEEGKALCFVDLDTLARMPIPVELGDALRSWCSPLGEEVEGPIDLDFLDAALDGYARCVSDRLTPSEREQIASTLEMISVELAARFCADALLESYFGWDPSRFSSAAEHNLTRARSQLALAHSIERFRLQIEVRVTARFSF